MAESGQHRIRYSDGREDVYLLVPWGDGSGNVPPPSVQFWVSDPLHVRTFAYQGAAPA